MLWGLEKIIEDYTIEVLKSDDGDSVTYDAIAFTDDVSGQKITFSGADKFVFHNIVDGVNYTNDNFSFGELVDSVDVIEDAKEDIIEDDFTLAMYAQFATGTGGLCRTCSRGGRRSQRGCDPPGRSDYRSRYRVDKSATAYLD